MLWLYARKDTDVAIIFRASRSCSRSSKKNPSPCLRYAYFKSTLVSMLPTCPAVQHVKGERYMRRCGQEVAEILPGVAHEARPRKHAEMLCRICNKITNRSQANVAGENMGHPSSRCSGRSDKSKGNGKNKDKPRPRDSRRHRQPWIESEL